MSTETIEQSVLEKLRALPPEKQQEVLDFVEFLEHKAIATQPRRSLMGLCADLNIHDEARREMWGNFPREDV